MCNPKLDGPLKRVRWMGDSLESVRTFPESVRWYLGFQLELVQRVLDPTDWKPMSSVGPGVRQMRSHIDGEHTVLYVAKLRQAVYVLHAFEKKSPKTPQRIIALASMRHQEALKLEGEK